MSRATWRAVRIRVVFVLVMVLAMLAISLMSGSGSEAATSLDRAPDIVVAVMAGIDASHLAFAGRWPS